MRPLYETTQLTAYPVSSGPKFTTARKLKALREYVLEDKLIGKELTHYILPNGQSSILSGQSEPLHPWIKKEFLDNEETCVLLLKGQAGVGKSMYNHYLLSQLWQDPVWAQWAPGDSPPSALVPIFIPLGSSQVDPKRLLTILKNLPKPLTSFDDEELNVLKEDYHLILIADGYDEIYDQSRYNLYDLNRLDRYRGRIKLLISSREQDNQERDNSRFMPCGDSSLLYRERYISLLTKKQIVDYLHLLVARKQDIEIYQKYFEAIPEPLICSPFLLWITVETLPSIIENLNLSWSSTPSLLPPDQTNIRLRLYDQFTIRWFRRQAAKAIMAKDYLENPEGLLGNEIVSTIQASGLSGDLLAEEYLRQAYRLFCQLFACHLQVESKESVQYPVKTNRPVLSADPTAKELLSVDLEPPEMPWVSKLFDSGLDWRRLRKGCPFRQGVVHEYAFLDNSFIDYFVAMVKDEQTAVLSKSQSGSISPVLESKSEFVVNLSDEPKIIAKCNGQLTIPPDPMTQWLFSSETIGFRIDALKENPDKSYYKELINHPVFFARVNAITILQKIPNHSWKGWNLDFLPVLVHDLVLFSYKQCITCEKEVSEDIFTLVIHLRAMYEVLKRLIVESDSNSQLESCSEDIVWALGILFKKVCVQFDAFDIQRKTLASRITAYGNDIRPFHVLDISLKSEYRSTLEIKSKCGDEKKHKQAEESHKLAINYLVEGSLQIALKKQLESLNTFKEIHTDKSHPHVAMSHKNLGRIYMSLKKYNEGVESFKTAWSMESQVDGRLNPKWNVSSISADIKEIYKVVKEIALKGKPGEIKPKIGSAGGASSSLFKFKEKLTSLCTNSHYKFTLKRSDMNKLSIRVVATQKMRLEIENHLAPAVTLLWQMLSANITDQQFETKPDWKIGLLTVITECSVLDKMVVPLLRTAGEGYFPSVAQSDAALFYTKKAESSEKKDGHEDLVVTCSIQ